jgi:hypothetical protein
MINRKAVCLLAGFFTSAAADETITVFQLDGSIHCDTATVTTLQEATDLLENADVTVVSATTMAAPLKLPGECGTPTGMANVLVVNAADWKRLVMNRPDAHGFGVWLFDQPVVEVYKYDGTLQCNMGKEVTLKQMARELLAKDIEVRGSRKGTDGMAHIAVCGASTGNLNIYAIDAETLPAAQRLGFRLLVTRQMTSGIKSPTPIRTDPAQPRTPAEAPGSLSTQTPRLW